MRFYESDTFTPDTSLGYLIRRAHQLGQGALEPVHASVGLTGTQWSTLMMLLDGRCTTCAELARDIAHDKGAMTRLIDQLEERGLVARDREADDRRVVRLSLTDAGRALAEQSRANILERWNGWLADWHRGDVETLIMLLRRLDATLEQADTGNV